MMHEIHIVVVVEEEEEEVEEEEVEVESLPERAKFEFWQTIINWKYRKTWN
jgi:hypothetical protein